MMTVSHAVTELELRTIWGADRDAFDPAIRRLLAHKLAIEFAKTLPMSETTHTKQKMRVYQMTAALLPST